ncbi:MAG: DUF1972 domain-containing protein [Bacteroidales bacterium]|nr:DUF1972 domain-containing protein [Bacteroidales bacterium]MCF8406060.1 DUF1972 domain-containing protein [Bacteroidales bacterium]
MKIGILGTRGIPNNYGGFEQFAEYLSTNLVERGCDVYVYNSHNHPYQEKTFNNVNIIHKYDPEHRIGTAGQFIYDLNCILDSYKRKFDIILQLGYTSSSVWGWLLPRKSIIIYNMDGFEWQRSKYSPKVQKFLKFAERLAVKYSDYMVSDSPVIEEYIREKYGKQSYYIPYGAEVFQNPDLNLLNSYNIKPYKYNLVIARMEPENNIEPIIEGVLKSKTKNPLLIIGSLKNDYGKYLFSKYNSDLIRFLGGIYDINLLNNLRNFCCIYFHGHSVGGTNPSLIEAMASSALICASNNEFNRNVLNGNAFYFKNSDDVSYVINNGSERKKNLDKINGNKIEVEEKYLINDIIDQYHQVFVESISKK